MATDPLLILGGSELELTGVRTMFRSREHFQSGDTFANRGVIAGRDIILMRSGPGRVNAVSAAAWGLTMEERVAAVLAVGFCSALGRTDLAYGDVLIPDCIEVERDAADRHAGRMAPAPLRPDARLAALAIRHASDLGLNSWTGSLITLDAPLATLDHKRSLAASTGARAADTETAGYGPAISSWKVPFVAIRVVLDGNNELPMGAGLLNPEKRGVLGQAIFEVVSHAKDLLGITDPARRGAGAAHVLAELVARMVASL